MLTGLIIILFLSCALGVHYANPAFLLEFSSKVKYATRITIWLLIYLIVTLICCYISKVGLPFGNQNIDINFWSLLSDDYTYNFVQTTIIIAIIAVIIYITIKYSKIPTPFFIVLLGILSIIIYYPGIPQADTNDLYNFYLTNNYTDWQPPLYTIWWHIYHNYSAAFLANTLSYYGGITFISWYLHKNNKTWQNYLLLLFCANPIFYSQLNIVLKDTLFIGLLTDLIAIYLLLKNSHSLKNKILLLTIATAFSFIAIGIRYNAILGVIPIYALIIWESLTNKNNTHKVIITTVATLIINFIMVQANLLIAYNVFQAKKVYSPTLVIYNDLINIECSTNHEFQTPAELFNKKYPSDQIRSNMCNEAFINYFNYDPIFIENWNNMGNPAIFDYNQSLEYFNLAKSSWKSAITSYPLEYLAYRLRFISNDFFAQYYMPTSLTSALQSWPTNVEKQNPDSIISQLQTQIAQIANSQKTDMAKAISIFTLCSIFAMLGFFIIGKGSALSKAIFLSNVASLLGLYLVLGEHAARFFLWNSISSIFMIIFASDDISIVKKPVISHKINHNSKKNRRNLG